MIYLLIGLVFAGALAFRRRRRNRGTRQPAAGTVLDLAWSWALSAWPQSPSPIGVTRRLIRWAVAERLPISADRFVAPSEVTLGVHPLEFDALEGRHEAVEMAIEEAMIDTATRLGWRSLGRPRVWIEVDDETAVGWPTIRPSYRRPAPHPGEASYAAPLRSEPSTVPLLPQNPASDVAREAATTHTRDHVILPNGEVLAIVPDGTTVIGRGHAADVVILDPEVSKSHALIRSHRGRTWVEDLESTNGTYLDGVRVTEPTEVTEPVAIRLGKGGPTLRFVCTRRESETRNAMPQSSGSGHPSVRAPLSS